MIEEEKERTTHDNGWGFSWDFSADRKEGRRQKAVSGVLLSFYGSIDNNTGGNRMVKQLVAHNY